jgi:large subunit ribosomal protein L35
MPKMRTKKIVAKRFKITASGKVMHRTQGARHLRSKKSKSHQRRQDAPRAIVTTKYSRMIKRFITT